MKGKDKKIHITDKNLHYFAGNNEPNPPNSFWEAARVQETTFFSTHTQMKQYFVNWEVCNLFYASFHMLLYFPSRDKSKAEIQYKTVHETPWKRINSLPTSIEWTLFQTNKNYIRVGCYVILDTLGPDCAVNRIQGSATKIRWNLPIITVVKSREMF